MEYFVTFFFLFDFEDSIPVNIQISCFIIDFSLFIKFPEYSINGNRYILNLHTQNSNTWKTLYFFSSLLWQQHLHKIQMLKISTGHIRRLSHRLRKLYLSGKIRPIISIWRVKEILPLITCLLKLRKEMTLRRFYGTKFFPAMLSYPILS